MLSFPKMLLLGPIEGTIVESSAEHGFGGTATVLVKRGTLKKGTYLVCGTTYAKVKLLLDTSAALEKEGDITFFLSYL